MSFYSKIPGRTAPKGRTLNIVGDVYGRLTLLALIPHLPAYIKRWSVRCSCGVEFTTPQEYLRSGSTQSCGCLHRERTSDSHKTHGMSTTSSRPHPSYNLWVQMRGRCNNTEHQAYSDYGGRGITVCPEWDDFSKFVEDMGARPEGCTLDRQDNSKGYCKANCKWSTRTEQARNRRSNRLVSFEGRNITLMEAVEIVGITSYDITRQRIARDGWSISRALDGRFDDPIVEGVGVVSPKMWNV